MGERLLTTRDVQDLLQLDRVTIYKMVKEGQLPALRMGGQWRFSAGAIAAWLQKRDTEARAPAPREAPAEAATVRLSDLISIETLQSIQDQFAHLLGVASFTIDLDGNPYLPCSRCSAFCQLVHTSETGMAGCRATWRADRAIGTGRCDHPYLPCRHPLCGCAGGCGWPDGGHGHGGPVPD